MSPKFQRTERAISHVWDHFVPHEGNNHHPHVLKHRVLVGYSVILILVKAVVLLAPIALPSSSLYSSAITPTNIISLTNQARENLNLPLLKPNDTLAKAASAKAADMLAHQYFSHTSPAGVTPWEWFRQANYDYRYAGENLAVHFHEAEDVEAGWMASPTHRANIVNAKYTEIGVGVATGQFENVPTTFIVQLFGRPATAAPLANMPESVTPTVAEKVPVPSTGVVAGANVPQKPAISGTAPTILSPVINESSLVVLPSDHGYRIRIAVDNAVSVVAQLGAEQTPLLNTDGVWQGNIAVDSAEVPKTGETISLTAAGSSGTPVTATLAIVSPHTDTQQFYIFNEGTDRFATLFGRFHLHNLGDMTRSFYLGFVVFLAAALLINLLVVRLRIHHPSVVSHAFAVIMLALFLSIV